MPPRPARPALAPGGALGLAALALAGCVADAPFGTPALSPIGEGLTVARTAIPTTVPLPLSARETSLYGRRTRELLTDVRANDVGDVVTVVVEIDDLASFENETEREREADTDLNFSIFGSGRGFDGPENSAEAEAELEIGSSSLYRGDAEIDRSERLRLRVAAIVTEVLPNGYLVIAGTQEIRVNAELRVLQLAGIVNPLDVSRLNTIDYERIAEARIAYGGRGTSSEIQAPNWGQRVFDRVVPF